MKTPKPFTAVHAIGFIYNAFAHVTDGEQVAEEISAVVESLADFNCSKEQIAEIYDWYCDVHAEGEEEMQKTLHNCIGIAAAFFKEHDPQKIVAKGFIDNLVDIAKADGVIKDSEKAWLTNFCKILYIEEPNILEENNEPDISTDDIIKGLEQSQKSDRPQIIMAIANQKASTEDIQEIVKADPNQVHATDTREDAKGYSALHYACWDGRTDLAKFLIEQGADIHLKGLNDGCTPLLLCGISPNYFECAKLLIELGAELENRNMESNMYHSNGATILRLAVINCCYDLADLLIEKGASLAVLTEPCTKEAEDTDFFIACRNICPEYYPQLYDSERLETIRSTVEGSSNQETNNEAITVSDENRSTLDRMTFFLLSFAQNDGIVKEEIQEVASIIESLLGDSFSFDKFKTGADWFQEEMEKVEWNREDKGLKAILKECIAVVEDIFGRSSSPEKRLFINQVIGIANADGQVGKSEIDWIERLCKGIDIEIPNILDEDPERRWDVEEEDDDKGYPMITVRVFKDKDGNDDTETQKLVKEYMMNWHEPTEEYNGRMGITARIPDFFAKINAHCPKWTSDEITNIKNYITKYKVIPSLNYVMEDFDLFTKNVWWLAPFVFWNGNDGEIASWLFIDKNGFYVAHPSDNDGTLIFTWDIINDMDTDWLEDNLVMLTLYGEHNDNEIELRICEFVSEGNGSYLEVMESIYSVYEKTIEESRGSSAWSHGAGGEGYEGFDNPKELLDENKWKAARKDRSNFKTHELFDYIPEEENENVSDNNVDTERKNADSQTLVSTDTFSFEDYISTYKENYPKEEQDENLLRAVVDFVYDTVKGTDGLLEVFSRTGGYSVNANNKLKNGKFAQVRWSKSDRKESKPVRYFVDLYLLKSKMDYKIDTLANQSLQSPHAHEFYMIRLYSQDDLDNFRQYQSLIMDSLKARQKNKLITKRKNLSKKQLKEEFLRDLGVS